MFSAPAVVELIGHAGIDFIIETLEKTLIKHKELFGDSDVKLYGMSPHQRFFDIQERVVLNVKALTNCPEEMHIDDYKQDYVIEVSEEPDFTNVLLGRKHMPSDHKVRKKVKSGS